MLDVLALLLMTSQHVEREESTLSSAMDVAAAFAVAVAAAIAAAIAAAVAVGNCENDAGQLTVI